MTDVIDEMDRRLGEAGDRWRAELRPLTRDVLVLPPDDGFGQAQRAWQAVAVAALVGAVVAVSVTLVGGGGSDQDPADEPGQQFRTIERIEPLGEDVRVTATGTRTIELGTPPEGTTLIRYELVCLTAGRFEVDDGSSLGCTEEDPVRNEQLEAEGKNPAAVNSVPFRGQSTFTVLTGQNARWRLVVGYGRTKSVRIAVEPFEVNEYGLTVGNVYKGGPVPDLIPTTTDDGVPGYFLGERMGFEPKSPEDALAHQPVINEKNQIVENVYAADGKTVVGTRVIGTVNPG